MWSRWTLAAVFLLTIAAVSPQSALSQAGQTTAREIEARANDNSSGAARLLVLTPFQRANTLVEGLHHVERLSFVDDGTGTIIFSEATPACVAAVSASDCILVNARETPIHWYVFLDRRGDDTFTLCLIEDASRRVRCRLAALTLSRTVPVAEIVLRLKGEPRPWLGMVPIPVSETGEPLLGEVVSGDAAAANTSQEVVQDTVLGLIRVRTRSHAEALFQERLAMDRETVRSIAGPSNVCPGGCPTTVGDVRARLGSHAGRDTTLVGTWDAKLADGTLIGMHLKADGTGYHVLHGRGQGFYWFILPGPADARATPAFCSTVTQPVFVTLEDGSLDLIPPPDGTPVGCHRMMATDQTPSDGFRIGIISYTPSVQSTAPDR